MSNNFPTKQNPQLCKNECGAKIYLKKSDKMNPKTGNPIWLPHNLDDTVHDCRKKTETKQQEFTLEAVLKKLAAIGIQVNLQELMKE